MVMQTSENLMNTPLHGKRGSSYKRYKKLETDRTSWRSHWIEITDNLLPRRGRYLMEAQSSRGRKRNTKIIDSTAGQALRVLSAGMMSGLTSPARPWFRLEVGDEEIMAQNGVKAWLGESERVIRMLLSSSNFYTSAANVYTELGAFGTSPVLRRHHPDRLLHYRPFTAGEYVVAENDFGDVDTLAREFQMTVSQMVEQFVINHRTGEEDWWKVSKAVKSLWDHKNYDELVSVIHMIQPRRKEEIDPDRRDGANRPVADIYFEVGADNDVLLQDSGYNKQPFYVPRWDVLGGDVYGTSPAMEALGDIKQLQHQQRRKAQAIDKMVSPPMVASNNMRGKPTTTMPAGVTYVDPHNGQSGFQPAYLVQPRLGEMQQDIAEVQLRIQRGFYADLFAMMINSDRRQITATEVVERHEEKLVLLGPVLQRLNTDYLDPLIDDAFERALAAGMLPPPPEALFGVKIDIRYVSLLAQAQEAVAATGIERTFGLAGNLSAVFEDITDNLDADIAFREYSGIVGNSPNILRDKSDVDQIRADRAQAAADAAAQENAAMGAQTAQTGAQAAKVLSETDTQTPNALTQILQGASQ